MKKENIWWAEMLTIILMAVIIVAVDCYLYFEKVSIEVIITITATLIVAISTVINNGYKIRAANKKNFINTITIARKEYMTTLREAASEFCVIAKSKENTRLIELSYQLKMLMNPIKYPDSFDGEAVKLIEKIIQAEDKKNNIDKFERLIQLRLLLEWHRITEESKQGRLSDEENKELRKKYYTQYTNWIEPKDNE